MRGRAAHFAKQNALRRRSRRNQPTCRLKRARPAGSTVCRSSRILCECRHCPRAAAFRRGRSTANTAKAAAAVDEGARTDRSERSASPFRRQPHLKATVTSGFCYPRLPSHPDKRRCPRILLLSASHIRPAKTPHAAGAPRVPLRGTRPSAPPPQIRLRRLFRARFSLVCTAVGAAGL